MNSICWVFDHFQRCTNYFAHYPADFYHFKHYPIDLEFRWQLRRKDRVDIILGLEFSVREEGGGVAEREREGNCWSVLGHHRGQTGNFSLSVNGASPLIVF